MSEPAPATTTAPAVRVARVVGATVADAYKLWTDPETAPKWWGGTDHSTVQECKMAVRVGGAFRFAVRKAGASEDEVAKGQFLEINPPHKVVFSWTSENLPDVVDTRVTVSFVDMKDNTCRIIVTHEGIKSPFTRAVYQSAWYNRVQDLALHFAA